MELWFCLGVLAVLLVIGQHIHFKEREALLDRLMARNYPEFVTYQTERRKAEISNKFEREEDKFVTL